MNIVKIFAQNWIGENNIDDEKCQEYIIKFANEIDKMLEKAEIEDEKK